MAAVITPREIGFCFGVKRAVFLCEEALRLHGRCVALGPVIHNEKVNRRLIDAGLEIRQEPAAGPEPVIIRSHGVHPGVRRELERQNRLIIDATCPFVRRVQELVSRLREERCRVVIVGKPDHPEVEALKGFAGKDAIVYPVGKNRGGARAGIRVRDGACPVLAVVSQTTNTETLYLEACREILARARAYELRFFDTVCRVTEHRQSAALKLARRVDVMIVAGSPGSANTRNLHHLLLSRKPETFLVAGAEDIKDDWCVPGLVVGLVSGTSTPAETINLIKKKLKGCDPDAGKLRGNF